MYSFRTHNTKFSINTGDALIFIFQLQFSTVILPFRKILQIYCCSWLIVRNVIVIRQTVSMPGA